MADKSDLTTDGCLAAALSLLIVPVSVVLDGLAFMLLWRWFVATTWGVAELQFWAACGVAWLVSFATHHWPPLRENSAPPKDFLGPVLKRLGMGVFLPLWAIGIGFVLHLLAGATS